MPLSYEPFTVPFNNEAPVKVASKRAVPDLIPLKSPAKTLLSAAQQQATNEDLSGDKHSFTCPLKFLSSTSPPSGPVGPVFKPARVDLHKQESTEKYAT